MLTSLVLVGSKYFIHSVMDELAIVLGHDGHAYSVQDSNGVITAVTLVEAERGIVHRLVADTYAECEPFFARYNGFPYSWHTMEV